MRVAQLGNSGVALSRIGLGGFELGPDDDKPPDVDRARAAIAAAMASGVNWIDTSENYISTANESLIGAALDGVEGEFSGVQQGGTGAGHHRRWVGVPP